MDEGCRWLLWGWWCGFCNIHAAQAADLTGGREAGPGWRTLSGGARIPSTLALGVFCTCLHLTVGVSDVLGIHIISNKTQSHTLRRLSLEVWKKLFSFPELLVERILPNFICCLLSIFTAILPLDPHNKPSEWMGKYHYLYFTEFPEAHYD